MVLDIDKRQGLRHDSYLERQGDLVSRLIKEIVRVIAWLIRGSK